MVSRADHVKGVLGQALESYDALGDLDSRMDLGAIGLELARINGFFRVVLKKGGDVQSSDLRAAQSKIRRYLESYDFEREIETMSGLYAGDEGRVRSMRLKILEALGENRLVDDVRELVREL